MADTEPCMADAPQPTPTPTRVRLAPLPPFEPDLYQRAWCSIPHPTLPLLATCHQRQLTVFSLATMTKHSALTGAHERSVRAAAWKPGLPAHELLLVGASFDATASVWRYNNKTNADDDDLAMDVTAEQGQDEDEDWTYSVLLEGMENELKSVAFSPSGQYLATCCRDKSVWIWEDSDDEAHDEDRWQVVAVLNEHDGDVKMVAWCPDVPGRSRPRAGVANRYSHDVLATASYDDTVRVWREDADAEWVCVAVLQGHASTVWGVQFEPRPRPGHAFPRLLTWSADRTLRIWELEEGEDEDPDAAQVGPWPGVGVPNRMRPSMREEWKCTTVLPSPHTRDVYSATWSGKTGLVASTGSDTVVAVYGEHDAQGEAASDGKPKEWRLLATERAAHGPYEVNHITWCTRFDADAGESRGEEEMLVTTGDDGLVRPWKVST